ncbi:Rho termination factor N-terminal domain-containing protein [Pseudomonas koreensis]|uniref:Rho termination factor N-terminal domain-containing protein n=1 Tax=Pseudomonas koreensis TaxID=198620 RepID=UPI0021C897A5|nr:Rho termination factor N-terminal domain-containing protein [Pseudomonas koreensis]MCU0071476.1 Rho termination factor N-terminal domain-containing protein [Pseudomonas koreensis]
MPRGSKAKYTTEQKRKAAHIEDSYEKKGISKDEAEARERKIPGRSSMRKDELIAALRKAS